MTRTQLYLGGLLIVQVVLLLVFRSPFGGAAAGFESRPLLPALEAVTPSVVEILGSEDDSIKLVRRDGSWLIESLGDFPADAQKIEELLGDLQDLQVRRPVVSSGRYHDSFKVADDDHEGRIRIWSDGDAEPDADLYVGSSPNFRTSHMRLAGEDAVYEVRGFSSFDVKPASSNWIERKLIDIDETGVVGFTLTNAAGSFELFKDEGIWKVRSPEDGAELDQGKVESLIRSAASVRLDDAAGALDEVGHGFSTPAATIVLRYADGAIVPEPAEDPDVQELTLVVGGTPADDESRRYVTRDGFGFSGTIWESSVRRLLEEKLDDLAAS